MSESRAMLLYSVQALKPFFPYFHDRNPSSENTEVYGPTLSSWTYISDNLPSLDNAMPDMTTAW